MVFFDLRSLAHAAELDERVLALPNVRHIRALSETLRETEEPGAFDVVVNDMNMDPALSAQVLCQVAPLIKPGGLAVLTVKYVSRRQRQHVEEALEGLAECYDVQRVGRVAHNARETTLVATRKV